MPRVILRRSISRASQRIPVHKLAIATTIWILRERHVLSQRGHVRSIILERISRKGPTLPSKATLMLVLLLALVVLVYLVGQPSLVLTGMVQQQTIALELERAFTATTPRIRIRHRGFQNRLASSGAVLIFPRLPGRIPPCVNSLFPFLADGHPGTLRIDRGNAWRGARELPYGGRFPARERRDRGPRAFPLPSLPGEARLV